MGWRSTRGQAPPVTFREALFAGLAPDGGLYLPERIDPIPDAAIAELQGRTVAEVGTAIAVHLLGGEIPHDALAALIGEALDFDIPLVRVGPFEALELFHGPTFAFKDVGARVMARLVSYFVAREGRSRAAATILAATSGDTGSAVAQAFAGVPGTRVVVLYPDGQVSDVQEAQFATLGGNVQAVAVQGTFDDCQALVKAAFSDPALREAATLTSANSINVGRLLPQVFYYAWGARQRPGAVWSVPSGNFGNLTAGLIARQLGFPIARFVAATNVNDVVPQYLLSGTYAPRASVRTVANAMDVGAPSNFERIRALYGDSVDRVRIDVYGAAFDDARVRTAIAEVHARHGYVLDPHSAIAWLGLQHALEPVDRPAVSGRRSPVSNRPAPQEPPATADQRPATDLHGIFIATAHPAKFRETVEPAIGEPVRLPRALEEALARPRAVTRLAPTLPALAELLR